MRMLLRLVRAILGPILLFIERVTSPKPMLRDPQSQTRVDQETGHLALYQFETCPFCIKVRRAIRRLNLKIELRNIRSVPAFEQELIREGGQLQVPCLKISESPQGHARWLYESDDIIAYLKERFEKKPAPGQ